MKSIHLLALAGLAVAPGTMLAQAAPAAPPSPQMRYVTVTTFNVPLGPDRATVMEFVQKWLVTPAKMNPNVLSYRIGAHNWGSDATQVVIMAEYPNWAAIEAPCAPCEKWQEENMPKEGTPERAKVDAARDVFLKYYSSHGDQIYAVNMQYAK